MDLRTFRVNKAFQWNGVSLRRGDVWLVDMASDRQDRIESLLNNRFAFGDATLPSGDEAVLDAKLKRQLPKTPVGR